MKITSLIEKKNTVLFLGGTCNDSTWRDELIEMIDVSYFNPVVDDWTEEAQEEEFRQRKSCTFVLYVITPLMKGVFSIAEVVQDSLLKKGKTLFCVLEEDDGKSFDIGQIKSLDMVKKLVKGNGAVIFDSLEEIAEFLNN